MSADVAEKAAPSALEASPSTAPISRNAWLVLGLLMVVGAGLRLNELDRQSAWADELYRINWAKGYQIDHFFDVLPSETGARQPPASLKQSWQVVSVHNPPLNALFINMFISAMGRETDFIARFPAVFFGVLSILGVFLAASRALGTKVGLWAAGLIAVSPFQVFYAQEASHYTPTLTFVAFSLYFYFRWLERRTWGAGIGLALFGLAALYSHYYAGIALAFQGLEIFVRYVRKPKEFLLTALPYAGIAAGFGPYLPTVRGQLGEMTDPSLIGQFLGADYFFERMRALGTVPWFGERDWATPQWAIVIALCTLVVFIIGLLQVKDRDMRRALLINGFGPVVTVIIMFWTMKANSVLWSRYQIFFTVAQVIPIAAALTSIRWLRWVATPALAVMAFLGLQYIYTDLLKEDWKHAGAFISTTGSVDEGVIVYIPNMTWAIARYMKTENRLYGVDDGAELEANIVKAVAGHPGTWFATGWATGPALPATVHAYLACHYAHREDFPVASGRIGMTLTRYWEPKECPAAVPAPAPAAPQ